MPCDFPITMYRVKAGRNAAGKWPLTPKLKEAEESQEPIKVPCGRCTGCRIEYRRQWAIRCEHESRLHLNNCFITLTYNDDSLPWGSHMPTLDPQDLTNFFKRLRKELAKDGISIRYFACGEYGSKGHRPHYHACLFGFDFPDRILSSSEKGYAYFVSPFLNRVWGNGNCIVADYTFETASYVAGYVMDQKKGKSAPRHYYEMGLHPEFVRMSRNPGLGSKFYEKYVTDMLPHDKMIVRNGQVTKPPRYYMDKYMKSNPDEYEKIKAARLADAMKNPKETRFDRRVQKDEVRRSRMKNFTRDVGASH